MDTPLQRTPLYPLHLAHQARMVPFAGWAMPVQYTGIIEEHLAVRQHAGLFDVSHMGEALVEGPDAAAYLDHTLTNLLSNLQPGQARYSPMCHPHGGVVDDLIVYRLSSDSFFLCLNASNTAKDIAWLASLSANFKVRVTDVSTQWAQLAIQGPHAWALLTPLLPPDFAPLQPFTCCDTSLAGRPVRLSATGYTGEPGCEIYCRPEDATGLAEQLLATPEPPRLCGLGARDSLRLEAGMPLYGHELTDDISPIEASLSWTVKFEGKKDFVGRAPLLAQKQGQLRRKLLHYILDDRRIAREGSAIFSGERQVGHVCSGSFSPLLGKAIGSALLTLEPDGQLPPAPAVAIRDKRLPLHLTRPPLHRSSLPAT